MRPNTPPQPNERGGQRLTVKRACERCGRDIGDATAEELEAAMDGIPLPSVADECGCLITSVAVLTISDHYDVTLMPEAVGGGIWRFTCRCGQTYDSPLTEPSIDALQAHQVEVLYAALREVRS